MTESQSDAAHEAPLTGDAADFPALPVPGADATQTIPVAAEAWRGSPTRNEWVPSPWEETGNTPDPAPASPPRIGRIGKKTAWTLGGTAAIVIAVAALVGVSVSGGKTRTTAATASSAAPRASVPDAGKVMSSASESASSHRAPSASPSASSHRAAGPGTASAAAAAPVSAGSMPPRPQAAAPTQAAAAGPVAAGTAPAAVSLPKPVGLWYLNDAAGTTALDAMGVNPATGSNVGWCSTAANGNCANFNGTSSQFTTSGPVLDTAPGSSFTVSAWVFMTALRPNNGFETIVSQDGVYDSGFYLQYSGTDHRWAFARVTADTNSGPPGIRALSASAPSLSTWTHLVGVFDASDNQLRLYVNGTLEGTATDSTPFAATGHLAIGRAQFDGQPTDWFDGSANQIKVYNVALTAAQLDQV